MILIVGLLSCRTDMHPLCALAGGRGVIQDDGEAVQQEQGRVAQLRCLLLQHPAAGAGSQAPTAMSAQSGAQGP